MIPPLKKPLLYSQFKVNPPNGVLFYRPPGCGKTLIAKKPASILRLHFIEAKPSDLASTYVHGGQMKIRELFESAEKNTPTMVFLDELDALAPNRGCQFIGRHYKAEVNEFLVQLNDCLKRKILVIAATICWKTSTLLFCGPAALIAAGLHEPTFKPNSFFRTIFRRAPELAMKERKEGSEKILLILEQRKRASAREIAETLGLTPRAVEKHIAALKIAGRLKHMSTERRILGSDP